MKKIVVAALSLSLLAQPVFSEQMVKPGTCELIVAARPTLSEARAYVRREIADKQFTKIFKAQNGWYAISIGALKPDEEEPVMKKWKSSGRIPGDSYCSTGKKYTALYDWQTGNRVDGTRSASNTSKSSGRNLSDEEATAVAVGIIGAAVGILGGVAGAVAKSGSSSSNSGYKPTYSYELLCADDRLFGESPRATIPLGQCTGYESECEYQLEQQLDVAGDYWSICSKTFGSNEWEPKGVRRQQ